MEGILAGGDSGFSIVGSYIYFTAEDRFYAHLFGLMLEGYQTMQDAVISDRYRIHAEFFGPAEELRNAAHAVQETVFRVNMKMAKHGSRIL